MTKYKLAFVDATMMDEDELAQKHTDTTLRALCARRFTSPNIAIVIDCVTGDWVDFEAYIPFECEEDKLLETVLNILDAEGRNIEVFSVIDDKSNEVVMTEENIMPA